MADEQAMAVSGNSEAEEVALTIDEVDEMPGGEVEASRVDALLIKNNATGDTLFINMDSGEGVFIEGQQAKVELDDDGVVDVDVDLSFGSRKLEDTPDEPDAIPDLVGYLERWLLPERTAQHMRNFRRELLLAARSLLDAGIRGIERHDRAEDRPAVDADAPADYTGNTEAEEHEPRPRQQPASDKPQAGVRRIELE